MSFQYTDRITEYTPHTSIRAIKNVTRNEPFFYRLPTGKRILSPAVIVEAGVQAGAWMCMKDHDFAKRPVLLADEKTTLFGTVFAGDQIEFFIERIDQDDEIIAMRGEGRVRGQTVLLAECVRGYLLPMEQFADPQHMGLRFERLYRPDCRQIECVQKFAYLPESSQHGSLGTCKLPMLDAVGLHEFGVTVEAYKHTSHSEAYLIDHFPRQPVVPGVILLTMIGEAAQLLTRPTLDTPSDVYLVPTQIGQIRFRNFVHPGDALKISLQVVQGTLVGGEHLLVKATITTNAKRVLTGHMGFDVHAHVS